MPKHYKKKKKHNPGGLRSELKHSSMMRSLQRREELGALTPSQKFQLEHLKKAKKKQLGVK